jgi:molybdate transport system regulatory protein
MDRLKPKFKLWLSSADVEGLFGDGKYRLLKSIEVKESLRAASKSLHISYRKAWGDLKKAQDAMGIALVERQRGGSDGGRTVLTEHGRQWLEAYSHFRRDVEVAVEKSFAKYFGAMGRTTKPAATPCSLKGRGFSLIEIIVVVSIIALLLALVMPALGRARALARQTVCQSRLRQWGLAFAAYAADNAGYYPHIDGRERSGDDEPFTPEGIADYYFGWADVLAPLMGEKPWSEHDRGDYPGTETVFQCPSAQLAPESLYSYKPRRNGYFSYAMNSCLELDANCWPPYDRPGGNNMPSFLNVASIKRPMRVILLFDQLLDPLKGYGGSTINRSAGHNSGSYPKAFSARHAKARGALGGFVLYCDYHVAWKKTVWKAEWPVTSDFEAPPRDDPDWYPY